MTRTVLRHVPTVRLDLRLTIKVVLQSAVSAKQGASLPMMVHPYSLSKSCLQLIELCRRD